MTIKITFNKKSVNDGTFKARVFYSKGGRIDKSNTITIYAMDPCNDLDKIFPETVNNSNSLEDYFEKGRVNIPESSKYYSEALKRCK